MKQTAVEWLDRWFRDNPEATHEEGNNALEQAKEMEKQQIIDAWNSGDYAYFYSKETGRDFVDGNEYYNETYGSKGSDEYPETEGTMAICNDIISSQTEISDEEIRKAAKNCRYGDISISVGSFELGARWYREQLKQRQ